MSYVIIGGPASRIARRAALSSAVSVGIWLTKGFVVWSEALPGMKLDMPNAAAPAPAA